MNILQMATRSAAEQIVKLRRKMASPQNILITAHVNPDGDAIGSSVGLGRYLKEKGHTVTVMMPNESPVFLDWLDGFSDIINFEKQTATGIEAIEKAAIIFSLDYNALSRVEAMGEYIQKKSAYKILIDHHLYPEEFADILFSNTAASSTAELVYDFIQLMGDSPSNDVLEPILVGILTDTGSFSYNTSPKLFRIIATIIENGIDLRAVHNKVFNSQSEQRLKILGHSLLNRMEVIHAYHTGIIAIPQGDFEEWNIDKEDLEGVVNQILKIKNIRFAALITQRDNNKVKLSLRSKGDFSVQELATAYFNGGGHKNAAGGSFAGQLEDCVAFLKNLLPNCKELA
jgi:phosphoesterase RecJ-like protein